VVVVRDEADAAVERRPVQSAIPLPGRLPLDVRVADCQWRDAWKRAVGGAVERGQVLEARNVVVTSFSEAPTQLERAEAILEVPHERLVRDHPAGCDRGEVAPPIVGAEA